ncbi:MAG TPA: efflux transporter outer membrane subunit [Planctomycetota bacterium]|nr:efflux transporter outer membrane subunit [Planctomycetota bacterium]
MITFPRGIPARCALAGARLGVLAVALGSGCTVGPEFNRPEVPAASGFTREPLAGKTASADGVTGGEEQKFVLDRDVSHEWWTLFQSPELSALISRALKASPTLAAAKAALRQAQEIAYAQQGFYYPAVGVGFTPSYQKASATLSPPLSTNSLRYPLYTLQATVAYTPDVFGGNRRMVESLEAQAESQRFQLEAAYVTLETNLVGAAVQEASLRAQIGATRSIIDIASRSLELLRLQLKAGAVTGLDVAAQEATLAQVQQALPPLLKQLEQNRDLLTALAGGLPGEPLRETFELSSFHLPQELPVTLPSKLVEQRPDVRAAEAQLHAASAQIGVAVAKRLPQFSLSAGYGGMATDIGKMFSPVAGAPGGNPFWSIVGSVSQTLLDGGTLAHQEEAARAAFDQAGAIYRSTVISAFQNVADTLYGLQADADSLKAALTAERAAKVTLDITVRQEQAGQVNYLSLLTAQVTYQQALIARVQAQANRFSDTAALFQALGGGWWNRPPESPKGP